MRRGIFYIDFLDGFSLTLALISVFFFKRVYFHNAAAPFRGENARRWLRKCGIRWLGYIDIPVEIYTASYPLGYSLDQSTVEQRLGKSPLYQLIIGFFSLDDSGREKFDACLRDQLLRKCLQEGTSSITLIKHVFADTADRIWYMPSTAEHYLLASVMDEDRIRPVGIHALFDYLYMSIKKSCIRVQRLALKALVRLLNPLRIRMGLKKQSSVKKGRYAKINPAKFEVAFFPSKNLYYGKFFKKTYLYENDPNSIFFHRRLLTLFHSRPDPLSYRYLRFFRIPYANINEFVDADTLKKERSRFLKAFRIRYGFKGWIEVARSIFESIVIWRFARELFKGLNQLGVLSSLKLIFVHNDALFPKYLLLACHLRYVKTVAAQERFMQYHYFGNFCFDHYLIGGKGFVRDFKKSNYRCGKYHVIGLPRARYIQRPFSLKGYERFINLKKHKFLLVCFGLHANMDAFHIGINGDAGTAPESVKIFMTDMINVARSFPKLYLVLRFKATDFLDHVFFTEIVREIRDTDNIEIEYNIKRYNSYTMAHLSDLIVGKSTSIMEESLAAGKTAIYYDNENYIGSHEYFPNRYGLVAQNLYELKSAIAKVLHGGEFIPSSKLEKIRNEYLLSPEVAGGFTRMKSLIKDIFFKQDQLSHNGPILDSPEGGVNLNIEL